METRSTHLRSAFHVFVGATEHLDLRAAAERNLGKNFDLKKYNDEVISYGSPPVKYVRELMGL